MPRTKKQNTIEKPIKRPRKKKDSVSQSFQEGMTVRNRYSNMEYKVVRETDKTVFVKENTGGTIEMAKADLELV